MIFDIIKKLFGFGVGSVVPTKTKIKRIIIAILAIVVVGAVVFISIKISRLSNELNEQKIKAAYYLQNFSAYKDSSNMKADTIQVYAIKIVDLQSDNFYLKRENKKLKNQIVIMSTQYEIVFDSLKVLNQTAQTHNYGDSIVVVFEGKKGRVSYKGQTTYFVLPDSGTYSIGLWQDPIKIVNSIKIDSSTNVIYSEIYADGVLIDNASTQVDSSIYAKLFLSQDMAKMSLDFWDRISFVLESNQRYIDLKESKINVSGEIGLQYRFPSNLSIRLSKDIINNQWITNIKYDFSIKTAWKLIF